MFRAGRYWEALNKAPHRCAFVDKTPVLTDNDHVEFMN